MRWGPVGAMLAGPRCLTWPRLSGGMLAGCWGPVGGMLAGPCEIGGMLAFRGRVWAMPIGGAAGVGNAASSSSLIVGATRGTSATPSRAPQPPQNREFDSLSVPQLAQRIPITG
jgi:hypothetical protein